MKIPKYIANEITNYYSTLSIEHAQNNYYMQEFLAANEDFVNAKNALRKCEFDLAKAEYNNDENIENLKLQRENLQKRLDEILKSLVKETDNFKIKYKCEKCKDTGFFEEKLCKCYVEKAYEIMLKKVGVITRKLHTFEDDTLSETCGLTLHYEIGKTYAEKFNSSNLNNLVFTGKSGTGKTFLAECIASKVKADGYFVLYLKSNELNSLFLQIHIAPLEEKTEIYQILTDVDLLVIDDLGTEPIYKNVTTEYLLSLITDRINLNKNFIITTNLKINEIKERYDERIFSRLLDKSQTRIMQFDIDDLRIKK